MAASVTASKVLHTPSLADKLPVGWSWQRLDDCCEGVFDCPHSTPKLTDFGPYVVRSQDIRSGVFRTDLAARVSEETYHDRIDRAEPHHGDLLYSREGTYFGIAAEVPPDVRVCLGQRMVLIRPDPSRFNSRYLKHWLNSPILAAHVGGHRDGTVAERLNLPTIRGLPIPVAPLAWQHWIGDILGTIDDKIELNRRTNDTLESMAQALFKSWFIDFDPVHNNATSRNVARLDATTSNLFPASFEKTALGQIPKGWNVRSLGEVVEFAYGKALKEDIRRPGHVPVFGSNGQVGWHDTPLVSGPGIVVGRKGNPGIVTWSPTPFYPIDTTFYVIPTGDCQSLYFLYYALRSHNLASLGADSAVPGLNRNMAYMSQQLLPSEPILRLFDSTLRPIFERIHHNQEESRNLVAARDALLPKLLSGELNIDNLKIEVVSHG